MTRITQAIDHSPFRPIQSFTALACGLEHIQLKDGTMIDLQHALDQSRKLHETLAMAKGAAFSGGDAMPILADAKARLVEVANAMGHFADPIDALSEDEQARLYAEGHGKVAAE